jgi:steroid delta-isomerase-like uncharacterized protein
MADNVETSRRLFDAWNTGDYSAIDEFVAADAPNHDPALPDSNGAEGFKEAVKMYRAAFPDISMKVDEMFEAGDKVVTRWTSEGTNTAEMAGMPPTGKHVVVTGISIDRFEDGKVVESWTQWDNAGLMQQLGIGAEQAAGATA